MLRVAGCRFNSRGLDFLFPLCHLGLEVGVRVVVDSAFGQVFPEGAEVFSNHVYIELRYLFRLTLEKCPELHVLI